MSIIDKFLDWFLVESVKDRDKTFYITSIVFLAGVFALYGVLYLLAYITGWDFLVECKFRAIFGIPCPGCGGTHAVIELFEGHIIRALEYNAFAVYIVVFYTIFFISQSIRLITKGRVKALSFANSYLFIGLFILVVQYILKLIMYFQA